ncbi:MAG: right-handed parallel beta-helix repeat-containing protein [Bacteroidales bacterium]|nr:right-handed parallel beta-helix repeat-containing protein [Bacteroidales bacterium]
MKRLNILIGILMAAAAVVSCENEEMVAPSPEGMTVTLGFGIQPKAVFTDEQGIVWEAGSRLMWNEGDNVYTLKEADIDAAANTVTVTLPGLETGDEITVNTPSYGSYKQETAGKMNPERLFLSGKVEAGKDYVHMSLVGSIIRFLPFTEDYSSESIKTITFESGEISRSVILTEPMSLADACSKENSKGIYLAMEPGTYPAGFNVRIKSMSGWKYTFTSTEPLVLTGNTVTNMSLPLDAHADYEEGVRTRTFYVSPDGDNSRTKSEAKSSATPWKTVQHGVNNISAGDTLIVMDGTYNERIVVGASSSGTAENPTVIMGEPGSKPVIDDGKAGVTDRNARVFYINGADHITVNNISIVNGGWYGFELNETEGVTIEHCSTYNTRASGIIAKYCTDLVVQDNEIRKACQELERDSHGYGSHECITVSRTDGFLITRNEVWDTTDEGDAGGEGIDSKGLSRNGEISYNYIHNIARLGLYVDAGSGDSFNIRVHSNRIIDTDGMSVAAELGGKAKGIYFYNNLVVNTDKTGFVYQNIMNGGLQDIYVVNNTFVNIGKKGGFSGEIGNYNENQENSNLVIRNNIFYNPQGNQQFSIWHNDATPHDISHNLYFYFKPGYAGGENNFDNSDLTSADVVDKDPLLTSPATGDYSLTAGSPAKWAGIPIVLKGTEPGMEAGTLLFDTDMNGKKRSEGRWSMGAYEF